MKKTSSVDIESVRSVLESVFGSTYEIYVKTHSYHWNVVAPDFYSAHKMLEEQYTLLWKSLDEIAERFRVFDLPAPAMTPSEPALPYGTPKNEMFADLLATHEKIIESLRDSIDKLEKANDAAGADFLTTLLAVHEKFAWMLRASL